MGCLAHCDCVSNPQVYRPKMEMARSLAPDALSETEPCSIFANPCHRVPARQAIRRRRGDASGGVVARSGFWHSSGVSHFGGIKLDVRARNLYSEARLMPGLYGNGLQPR